MKIIVLGGCGVVGSVAVKTLAANDIFSDIVIGDLSEEKAKNLISRLNTKRVSFVKVDATDPLSIKKVIKDSDVVLNCAGPFYELGFGILQAVIDSGINYVDVCDDYDSTEKLLTLNEIAKEKSVSALIGMGSSPGIANILVRFCAANLLDELDSIDIYHAHGGEPEEGPAVVKHRIHSMMMDIPVFLDGNFTKVNIFKESGKALEETVEFLQIGTYKVYAYPHPETITLPKYFKVKRVTNLGTVLPPAYAELIKDTVKSGIMKDGLSIEAAVSNIIDGRKKLLKEAGMTEPMGCLKVVVKGKKNSKNETYTFSMSSKGSGMGEGTGISAALGASLMAKGRIDKKGVFPPESAVKPIDIFQMAKEMKIQGGSGLPLIVQKIDEKGNIVTIVLEKLVK
ncbi:MAG: saccharopine dehydrogenase NADP-binding domain-containing protein [Elusimicrobiota bacterium]